MRVKNPAHPGGFIRGEIVEALGLSVTDAALALRVTRPALSALLNERADLSSEMALRLEKAFGVSMDTLMRMQNSFDIARARRREGDIKVAPFKGKPMGSAAFDGLTRPGQQRKPAVAPYQACGARMPSRLA